MELNLPLDQMTVEEKLQLMEVLWDDLSRTAEDVPSPAWHAEVLAERERLIESGQAHFVDLAEMEERLRKALP
jgi:hypothetical protein